MSQTYRSYVVRFYRKAEKRGDKDTYLGSVEIDDFGLSDSFTLEAKAFRQAPPKCLYANKLNVSRA